MPAARPGARHAAVRRRDRRRAGGDARRADGAPVDDWPAARRRMASDIRARDPGTSAHGHLTGAPSRSLRLRRGDTFRMAEVGRQGARLPGPRHHQGDLGALTTRPGANRPPSVAATAGGRVGCARRGRRRGPPICRHGREDLVAQK